MKIILLLFIFCLYGILLPAQQTSKSVQWDDAGLPVVHLSMNQAPEVQVMYEDTINAMPGDHILLDTLIKVQGTANYTLNWSLLKDQQFVPVSNNMQVFENTEVHFLMSYNTRCTYADNICLYTAVTENNITGTGAIIFYPNPATEKLVVEIPNALQPVHIMLVNLMGAKVLEKDIAALSDSPAVEFNLSDLLPGIYFIRINALRDTLTEKVIIVK